MANEKVITTAALIDKFKQALDDDWGYIWGTEGEIWTATKQAALDKTTDEDRANSRKYGGQWIGHRVSDCSGMFYWAFKQLGGYMYHGSDTMYRKYCTDKGELKSGKRTDGQGLKPGTAVFVWKEAKGKYTHVGLYVGNGMVIEAAGAQKGVISGKVSNKKWTHWGELKGVDYSGTTPEPAPAPEPEKKPTIRRGSKGPYVVELQKDLIDLGYDVGKTGADGKFGANTEKAVKAFQRDHDGPDGRELKIDGIVGQATWWALQEALGENEQKPAEERYTVTITGLTKEQAEEVCRTWSGAIMEKQNI